MAGRDPVGLERGIVPDHLAGIGIRRLVFGHVGRDDLERQPQLREQLLPAR